MKMSIFEDSVKIKSITLANVLYMPDLDGDLISIGRMEERGFKTEFAEREEKVLSHNNEIVFKGKEKEGFM